MQSVMISAMIPRDMKKIVDEASEQYGFTMSGLIRAALRERLIKMRLMEKDTEKQAA